MRKFEKSKIFSQYWQLFVLVLVSLALFIVLRTGLLNPVVGFVQTFTLPIQTSFYASTQGLKNTAETFATIGSLRSDNSRLKQDNAKLLSENTVLKKLEEENRSLREQLKIPVLNQKIKVAVSPIGFSAIASESYLLVNAGSNVGIKKGDFALVQNILIGKIVQVGSKVSSVQLLTDPDSKIPVKTETGSEGLLEGQFGSSLVLTNVSQDQELKVGQLILTSGKNNYPKNLVVGRIKDINRIEKELFQKADVEELLEIEGLSLVYIVSGE